MGSTDNIPIQPQNEPTTIVSSILNPVGIRQDGTLPLPPTQVLVNKSTDKTEKEIKKNVEIYLTQVQPIFTSSEFFHKKIIQLIEQDNQLTDLNTFLEEYSQRLFYLYQSGMLLKVPDEATEHHKYLLRTLADQKEWVDELMNKIRMNSQLNIKEPVRNFPEVNKFFQSLALEFNLEYPLDNLSVRSFYSDRHGVKVNFPGDWILADNDFQLALIAPVDLQGEGIEGLGLSNQKYGSAFKLWAVNNKEGLNLNEADIEVEQFINAFGNELDREFISVDNTSATKRILKNSTLEWQTLFIMMVNHDKKYFVEAACPETNQYY